MPTLSTAEHIRNLRPYVPGKPIEEVQRELGLTDVIKLASNENPLGPSPLAVEAMRNTAAHAALYPEGNAPALREAVSALAGMPPDTLVFGNGSDEVLHLMALSYLAPGDEVVQGSPSFAMYELYTRQMNAVSVKVPLANYTHDLGAMAEAITHRTRLVFVANPNNPTGTLVTQSQVDRFLERVPDDILVVFDEAYHEYVHHPDAPNLLPAIRDGRNVAVLRTFSKAYGLAGLRVGYGIMRPEIAETLNRVRSPFNVNLLAQAAATAAAQDSEHLHRTLVVNNEGREYFYREFAQRGLAYIPSEANFVMVDTGRDSREVFEALQRHGVIVRAGAGLGLPTFLRVSVGTMAQNRRFVAALTDVLQEMPLPEK